jgi:hypothetical protein
VTINLCVWQDPGFTLRPSWSAYEAKADEAVKIFMPAGRSKPVYAPYTEHVPPDVTAGIFWMKNRDPAQWRDNQQIEHSLGKYIISDRLMSEEEWARERADVLDAEPQFGDGREENHKAHADKLSVKK